VNRPLSGKVCRRTAKIHRTVRCAPDCPVSQRSAGPSVGRAICAGHVAEPTARKGHRTVWCAPDSVRCANGSRTATVGNGRLLYFWKEIGHRTVSGGPPDCPVRHPTEGKICLPGLLPTAPRPLVPIKGTPRRLKQCTSAANKCRHHSDQFSLSLLCVSL
jgi:hypothetical protein